MVDLHGIIPILTTAFRENGDLDLYSQEKLLVFLLEAGVHGIALFGTASEGYTLSHEERRSIFELARRVVDGKVPLIVSTGQTGTRLAVEQSYAAQQDGADGLMIVPPHYLKPNGNGVRVYYEAIANAVNIPIMVQDAPAMTGVNMPASLLAELCVNTTTIRYIKIEAPPTAPKISAFVGQVGASGYAFGGLNGQFLLEELGRGAVGTMPGSDLSDKFVEIWNLYQSGDKDGARKLFSVCLPLLRYELQPALGVATMKYNLVRRKLFRSATVRHPTLTLDSHSAAEIDLLWNDIYQGTNGED
jgi:2-keto-3-deoxy-L-arabinonate dehydratase